MKDAHHRSVLSIHTHTELIPGTRYTFPQRVRGGHTKREQPVITPPYHHPHGWRQATTVFSKDQTYLSFTFFHVPTLPYILAASLKCALNRPPRRRHPRSKPANTISAYIASTRRMTSNGKKVSLLAGIFLHSSASQVYVL